MPKTKPYVPQHAAPRVCQSASSTAAVSMRRILCVAGLAAAVSFGMANVALADGLEIPDGSWDPDIEVDIDGNPVETPALPEPDPEPIPQPDPTPDPLPEPQPQPGGDNPGWDVPDSGPSVPDYGDIYGNTSADSIGSGAGAFYDPASAVQTASGADAPQEEVTEIPVPVFGSYDAASNAVMGSATPGYAVQMVDAWGTVVGLSWINNDGTFWIQLPEGYDLASVSLVVVDGDGVWMSDVLTGESMVATVALQQRAAVLGQVGAATSTLAKGFVGSLGTASVGAVVEMPAEGRLPILPYAVGAGAALVAVAAVGGAVYAARRFLGTKDGFDDSVFAMSTPVVPAVVSPTSKEAGPREEEPRVGKRFKTEPDGPVSKNDVEPVCADARTSVCVNDTPFCDDSLDDLERLALGLDASRADAPVRRDAPHTETAAFAGARPEDTFGWVARVDVSPQNDERSPVVGFQTGDSPDTTIPCPSVLAPIDPDTFAATARVLATGSGRVHHITTSKRDLDMAGLDLFDESRTPASPQPSADPMIESGDWRTVALRELAQTESNDGELPGSTLTTSDYIACFKTRADARANEVLAAPGSGTYVAPVIGPSSVTSREAELHASLLGQAQTPQAVEMRERDAAFRRQKQQKAAQRGNERAGVPQDSSSADASSVTCMVSKDGVPIIARGSGNQTPGPARRSWTVGDVSAQHNYTAPRRMRLGAVPDLSRDSGTCEAVAFAPGVGSAGTSYAYEGFSPGASVAAAYAAAVYGRVACEQPSMYGAGAAADASDAMDIVDASGAHARHRQLTSEFVPVVDEQAERPYADEYDYRTETMLSPAYINYMVQDEFEHRHDTPAQRNAALGRMRIVNGAACPPVSVKESVARHRYMA